MLGYGFERGWRIGMLEVMVVVVDGDGGRL